MEKRIDQIRVGGYVAQSRAIAGLAANVETHHGLVDSTHTIPVTPTQSITSMWRSDAQGESGQSTGSSIPQLIHWQISQLCPHPSYIKHGLAVSSSRIDALARLGNRVFDDPIVVNQDGLIIDGYARWELARKLKMETVLCLVYQRTETEALCDLLRRHQTIQGLNDFTRIELSQDLKPFFEKKTRLNQQAGGHAKGSAKLEPSLRVDSRKQRARIVGVSEGNVSKVDRILEHGCSSTIQAAREEVISIHRANGWSRQNEAQQRENLFRLEIERGIKRKARELVSGVLLSRSKTQENHWNIADWLPAITRLSNVSPENSKEIGPVTLGVLRVPGKALYLTEELFKALGLEQERLIE